MTAAPRIPQVLHLYWDGSPMSFLQYLTVKSFQKHNQEWKIKLYLPSIRYDKHTWVSFEQKDPYTGKDYFDRIFDLDIEVQSIDLEAVGFANEIPEVVKSDYLRYKILAEEGGYWCDFDVLFFKPIQHIYDFGESSHVWGDAGDVDTIICPVITDDVLKYYTIGFLGSSPGNPFFSDLAKACKTHLDLDNYQSIGVNMIRTMFPSVNDIKAKYQEDINLAILPHQVYLPLEYNQTDLIFEDGIQCDFPGYTIGIHWFNGHPDAKKFQNRLGDPKRSVSKRGKLFEYMKPYLQPIKMMAARKHVVHKSNIVENFTETFEANLWGDAESKSGSGSRLESTARVRQELQTLFADFGIHTVADLGCGDFNWMRHVDLQGICYTGLDVVDSMVLSHIKNYSRENISFKVTDLTRGPIDKYDLVMLRDVLVHLTLEDCFHVLTNVVESGSRYLLATSFTDDRINNDLKYSAEEWRTLSLHKYPFNFPAPIRVLNEDCQEGGGLYNDKSLLLWEVNTIKSCLTDFEVSPLWFSAP